MLIRGRVLWKPLDPDFFKINVDASFVENLKSANVGVVARNHLREVVVSSWDFIRSCPCADGAELRVCLAGFNIGITLHKPINLKLIAPLLLPLWQKIPLTGLLLWIWKKKR